MKYILIIATLLISCNEEPSNKTENKNEFDTYRLEVPLITDEDLIIEHTNYSVSYVEYHELSEWVAYELTVEELAPNIERTDDFRIDPNVITGTAESSDYVGSGYDRGHLMPAADCVWSETAMTESFFYTNIAPQVPGLNRGEWSQLESEFRELAVENDVLWVVTGPIFDDLIGSIGENQVSVPSYYYKVGLCQFKQITGVGTPPIHGFVVYAFIMPNSEIDNELSLSQFQVSVDSLEKRTGIDFFPRLENDVENDIESIIFKNSIHFD